MLQPWWALFPYAHRILVFLQTLSSSSTYSFSQFPCRGLTCPVHFLPMTSMVDVNEPLPKECSVFVSWKIRSVITYCTRNTGGSCGNCRIKVALRSEFSLHLNMIMPNFSISLSEFSVSSHPLSCPSKDVPLPFISSFFVFPFQISVVRMKTKAFFLKIECFPTVALGFCFI